MDEILWELREHASGLNAGRWDYIFSLIKKFHSRDDMILPDRAQVTMAVPFMRAYQQLLVRTCHARGAHAIGGMSAFIPNRRQPEVTENALARVREDKQREAGDGSDGTWVAHPGPGARRRRGLRPGPRRSAEPEGSPARRRAGQPAELLDTRVEGGQVTEAGVSTNVSVALQYLASWLAGQRRRRHQQPDGGRRDGGDQPQPALAVADAWRDAGRRQADERRPLRDVRDAELGRLRCIRTRYRWTDAAALLDDLVLSEDFAEFLTLAAYPMLNR